MSAGPTFAAHAAGLCLFAFSAGVTAQSPSSAAPAGRFDGAWNVTINCPSNSEASGARGYEYRFPAVVREGVIAGTHGEESTNGWLHIEGAIRPDGGALLDAQGRTGDPAYAVKKPAPGTRYTYRIKAQFGETRGTGERIEARVCHFTFERK